MNWTPYATDGGGWGWHRPPLTSNIHSNFFELRTLMHAYALRSLAVNSRTRG